MPTRLSGVLVDAVNKPLANTDVVLLARGNTITVLAGTEAIFKTDNNGSYNIVVNAGYYDVWIQAPAVIGNMEPYQLGSIAIYADSPGGSLNSYLVDFKPEDTTPEAIAVVKELLAHAQSAASGAAAAMGDAKAYRDEAQDFKDEAKASATAAKTSETNSKTSETEAKKAQQGASGSANTASQAVTTIQGLKTQIETTSSQALTDIGAAKTSGVKAVTDAGTTSIATMNQLKTDTTALKDAAAASAKTASDKAAIASTGATTATEKATAAAGSAATAKTEADRAVAAAAGSLKKDQNLSDVADKKVARTNIGAAQSGVNADITETTKLATIKGVNNLEFLSTDLEYDIESLKTGGAVTDLKKIRRFRCSGGAEIWHETVVNNVYGLYTGLTPTNEVLTISSSGGGMFYKGSKVTVTGDYGLGYKANRAMNLLEGASGFYGTGESSFGLGSSVGFQASYGDERRGQLSISLDNKAFFRFCNTASNEPATHPWKQLVAVGDYGIGAVNPPQLLGANANSVVQPTGFYTALANDNELGEAWSIQGQAVGIVNLGMHHTSSDAFKGQIATSYSSNGRLFYRCSIDSTWRAWKEIATTGANYFEFGNNLRMIGRSGQATFSVQNYAKAPTDPAGILAIGIPADTRRAFIFQGRHDNSNESSIVNYFPALNGEFLVRNAYKLNLANGNWNNYINTQFTSFISGATTHGAQNGPNVGYGNMMAIGTGNIGATGDYTTQVIFDKSTAIPYLRCMNDNSAGTWTDWQRVAVNPVSDATKKNITGDMDIEEGLNNIASMEFKAFTFKDDETERVRRGVISQQIMEIDPEYVHNVGDHLCLDTTPMLLDGLAAIKALKARDEENKERISKLEGRIEQLENALSSLLNIPVHPIDPIDLP